MSVTAGMLLGGRVSYVQPAEGFRSALEPVLLAASIPARAGESVLEVGSGAGAGLLCLAARVPGVLGLGVELDAGLVALAERNGRDNGFSDLHFQRADIATASLGGPFDHAFANPPYHSGAGTPSPLAVRRQAKQAPDGLFGVWAGAMARTLRARGSLTLALPSGTVPEVLAVLEATGYGSIAVLPLWPRAGRPAKLVLLRALRGGRAPFRLLSGLELHDVDGFTPAANAILRDGQALIL